jgi:subtilisin family serine protease
MRREIALQAGILLSILLNVTSASAETLWVSPNDFDIEVVEGTILTETLTITNDGLSEADFLIRTHQVSSPEARGFVSSAKDTGTVSVTYDYDFTKAGNAPYKSDELIVRFAQQFSGVQYSTADKDHILSSLGAVGIKKEFALVPGLCLVQLPADMTVEEALQKFNGTQGILYAQPNYELTIDSTFPDDTRFDDLWGMHNTGQTGGTADADIDAPEAWDVGTGSSEIIVAVIDTGVDYTHPDLAGNMWTNEPELNGSPGVDDDGNGYIDDIYGYDFCNNDGNPMDDHYHGTHCAGTVGATGNNGQGVAGVCWDVRIMALKFLNSAGSGSSSNAIQCVEYSVLMGANLSSNSWGGGGYDQGLKDAIDAAGEAGMLFVAAAGNDNLDNDTYPHYPSSFTSSSLISVMATDKYDNKSSFSNYGLISVDLGAPGSSILSCQPGGGYQYLNGTSMATPHVAGACALLWSLNPAMSNQEIKNILLQSVDPTLPGLCVSGGRLNLYNATLELSVPWIEVEPGEGVIEPNGQVELSVTFNALDLVPGLYEAEILVLSDTLSDPIAVPVTLTVNPDDLTVTPTEGFESIGTRGGPFEPACSTYTLTNNNPAEPLNWTTTKTQDWFYIEPNEGVLEPNESLDINVCISADANSLDPNIYTDTLIILNTDTNSIKPRSISLTVKPPDTFTESFNSSEKDLENLMVTFMPDGSGAYYEACRDEVDEFPTDPNGGTYVALWDDDYFEVLLPLGKSILFYGTWYDRFYIGSNGYITFEGGDTECEGTLDNHFIMPRISGIFTDLSPQNNQCISYKLLDDRLAVTFKDVQLFGDKNTKNSFQIEMFYADGAICITWLDIDDADYVAGLSRGTGLPPVFFQESDLSEYPPCWPLCDFDRNYLVNFTDFAMFVMNWLDENCDIPYWCGKSDLDLDGLVGMGDLDVFTGDWLMKIDWFLRPVAHWKFDEGQGDIAYDSAGNNNGVIYGPQWTEGIIGTALAFDGTDDYVSIGPGVSPTGPKTISAWVKIPPVGQGSANSQYDFFILEGRQAGNVAVLFYFNDGVELKYWNQAAGGIEIKYTVALDDDAWHLVGLTYDLDTWTLFLDGFPVATGTGDDHSAIVSGESIGGDTDLMFRAWYGKIDDVRIYDRALSAKEIEELYRQGLGPKASNPSPSDGATGVDPNVVLSWSPGKDALSHDVYLGTNYDDVNDANTSSPEYMGNFDVNYFDPCGLEKATTFYWRIDELDGPNTYKGDVWNFKTWLMPNLVSWWKLDEVSGTVAYDSMGGNDGVLLGGLSFDNASVPGKIGNAIHLDGTNDRIYAQSLSLPTEAFTMAMWFKPDTNLSSSSSRMELIHWMVNQPPHLTFNYFGDGKINLFVMVDGLPYNDISTATNYWQASRWYHIAAVFDGSEFRIYVDAVAECEVSHPGTHTSTSGIFIGSHRSNGLYSFDGVIDDVRVYDRALSAEEIDELYREGLGPKASNPHPFDGQTGVEPNTILSWSPGKDALSHDVYLGTNYDDVNDANASSPEYMGNFDVSSYDPCGLEKATTYYWRIDELDGPNTYKGDVWSFGTIDVNFGLVSWWKFDEGSGSIAYDSAGDYDGTLIGGPSWVAGKIGDYALEFDGSNDCVDTADFDLPDDFSVAMWLNPSSTDNGQCFIGKNADSPDNIFVLGFWNGGYSVYIREEHYYSGVKTTGWQHVAVVVKKASSSSSDVTVYKDGVVLWSHTLNAVGGNMLGKPWTIGQEWDGSSRTDFFGGVIDDVRIYNRALTEEEINHLYLMGD